jgi:hypothetical protein
VLLWRATIRNDRLKPEAICSRDVDDNSCSHNESLNCLGRFMLIGMIDMTQCVLNGRSCRPTSFVIAAWCFVPLGSIFEIMDAGHYFFHPRYRGSGNFACTKFRHDHRYD